MSRLVLLCFIGVCCGFTPRSGADEKKQVAQSPTARKVSDQKEAISEARKVDIPLLHSADKVIVEKAGPKEQKRSLVLTRVQDIQALRETLKPKEALPSGGMVAATLTFYKGKRALRKVWVYEGGEWGFERVGIKYTTGANGNLWKLVQKYIEDVKE